MEGLNTLFHYYSIGHFKIDFITLEHGLTYYNNWLETDPNDHLFMRPKPWNIKYPIFGKFHFSYRLTLQGLFHQREIIDLTDSKFLS